MPGGKAPKRKGARWERECAEIFRERAGIDDIKRGIGQARSAHEVADVDGVPEYWIECKHGKNTAPKRALKQAEKALEASRLKGKVPIAVCKDDRERPTVTMYLDHFLNLAYPQPSVAEFVKIAAKAEQGRYEASAEAVKQLAEKDPKKFRELVKKNSCNLCEGEGRVFDDEDEEMMPCPRCG
jgi:Holliday junction resolvase